MANDPPGTHAAAGGPHEGASQAADLPEPRAPGGAQHPDVAADATAQLAAQSRIPGGGPAGAGATGHGGPPAPWPGAHAGAWSSAPPGGRPDDPWSPAQPGGAGAFGGVPPWGFAVPGARPENGGPGQPAPGRDGPGGWYAAPGPGRPPEQPGTGGAWHPGPGGFGPPPPGTRYLEAPAPHGRGARKRGRLFALGLVAVLLAGLIGGVVGNALAQGGRNGSIGVLGDPLPEIDEAAAPTTPVEAVAARVLPSVVQLRVEAPGSSGEGSAMVLSPDGLLLTNNHVVEAAADTGTLTAVFQDGTTAAALIVGRDPSSDLAVIRAQNVTGLVPVQLGNSDSVRVGQQVVAFGAPLGLGGTVTTGIISALDRAVNVGEETGANTPTVLNALQTDAAINPGNSGGPLVDMQGQVVGINSAIATTGAQGGSIGVGFSIPVNQARRVAEELERTGRASRAVLGVTVGEDPRQAGAIIRGVTPGGAAELAGIREGDVVLRFGDQRIITGTDLQAAVGSRAPGEVVEVQLADRTVQATLTAAPN